MTPTDILTKSELTKLVETLRAAMTTIMVNREVSQTITNVPGFEPVRDGTKHLGRNALGLIEDIGNNGAACIAALLADELPEITEEMLASARCAVWVSENPNIERSAAGITLVTLSNLGHLAVAGTADDALTALEAQLLVLFLVTHRLRKLPIVCRSEHLLVEDKHGHVCARCGERMEQ